MNRKILYFINPISGPKRKGRLQDVLIKKTLEQKIFFEIFEKVQSLTGRSCEKTSVSGCLQALDAILDEDGRWSLKIEKATAEQISYDLPLQNSSPCGWNLPHERADAETEKT